MNSLNRITMLFDVISFDVFDTLIGREVKLPEEIFRLAGSDVMGDEKAESFLEKRKQAERIARMKRHDGEVTLTEIYEELQNLYGKQTDVLMCREIERELMSCRPKQKNIDWMRKCIAQGKRVFLISDMYLSPEIITEMLNRCGVSGYEKLYVSNVYRKGKRTGELFRIVMSENNISHHKMLHIGDSPHGDVLGAWKAGIFAFWLPRRYY